ncbi:hypothetical protein [Halovenus halobia]|uniref:hypothetical protein n=1 Tax=Halovenus halobia TaxID=3396622 RepID=UPI003F57EFA2
MSSLSARTRLRQIAVGLYLCWLVAVVLSMFGRFTAFPTLEAVRLGMVVGAGVFTVIGAGQILRNLGERAKKRF